MTCKTAFMVGIGMGVIIGLTMWGVPALAGLVHAVMQ